VTTGRKRNMSACKEDIMKLGLGFLQYIVMDGEPKKYKYRYLGLREEMGRMSRERIRG
jgi:hypothetical protein